MLFYDSSSRDVAAQMALQGAYGRNTKARHHAMLMHLHCFQVQNELWSYCLVLPYAYGHTCLELFLGSFSRRRMVVTLVFPEGIFQPYLPAAALTAQLGGVCGDPVTLTFPQPLFFVAVTSPGCVGAWLAEGGGSCNLASWPRGLSH